MKITPLEIRQKSFEKKLRGYDKDEVVAFLQSLSNEWERVLDENKEYKIKLDQSQKEVQKLREVESSLFKTLKTAEDTGANLIDQANKTAELHLKEVQMNAEALMSEAKSKASDIIERAEQEAKDMIEEMQEAVEKLDQNYHELESYRGNVIKELKHLSNEIIDKISSIDRKRGDFDIVDYSKRVKELVRASEDRLNSDEMKLSKVEVKKLTKEDLPSPKKRVEEPAREAPVKVEAPIKNEEPAEKQPAEITDRQAEAQSTPKEEEQEEIKKKEQPKKEPVNTDLEDKGSFFDQIDDA
ncbi:MAG: DivIVA domain-containing protein [Cyclobacteriaceae bacterium]|nr:DivIVA domain-containing protein [Cyclobacteriaceae bacterium SS2]